MHPGGLAVAVEVAAVEAVATAVAAAVATEEEEEEAAVDSARGETSAERAVDAAIAAIVATVEIAGNAVGTMTTSGDLGRAGVLKRCSVSGARLPGSDRPQCPPVDAFRTH